MMSNTYNCNYQMHNVHSKLSKFDHTQSRATEQWIVFVESSVAEGNIILFFGWGFFWWFTEVSLGRKMGRRFCGHNRGN